MLFYKFWILNAVLRRILFNICIGVKEICNLLIWFTRLFSSHSCFQSECSLVSKSKGTELHTENRVAQKKSLCKSWLNYWICTPLCFGLVCAGFFLPFGTYMTVTEVLITTCSLVINPVSTELWNQISWTSLLEDDIGR